MAWSMIGVGGNTILGKSYPAASEGSPPKPKYYSDEIRYALVCTEPKVLSVSYVFYSPATWIAVVQVEDDGADEGVVDSVMGGYAS